MLKEINLKKLTFRVLDRFILEKLLYIFPSKKKKGIFDLDKKNIKNILIIREYTLGETILTLPMIKALKDAGYKVDIFCSKANLEIFKRVDFINDILIFEDFSFIKKYKKYDLVIDTEPHHNISALLSKYLGNISVGFGGLKREKFYDIKINYDDKIHAVLNFFNLLKPLKISINDKNIKLVPIKYFEKEKVYIEKLLKDLNINKSKLIGIHAGSNDTSPYRRWKEEKFAKLIEKLVDNGFHIVLTGKRLDKKINKKILSLLDRRIQKFVFDSSDYNINLGHLAYLLKVCQVFISNDTGPMHLSAAMGTKTIGLFGPNLPQRFGPFGENNVAIYKARNLPCSPCINVHKREFKKCNLNGKCMDLIEVEDVYKAVKKMI